ncbi:YwqG family protein [Bhargavaea ullalensis]|uniref:Uncharacterized protein YwqG n=1 Tax=Bhargavaea ullalensis TaxID=1265685 RepID=A0ABV2GB80_9BACL
MSSLIEQLAAKGLSRYEKTIRELVGVAVCVKKEDAAGPLAPGASKFGGAPDLPPNADLPQNNGRPLTLLAQINLTDLGIAGIDHPFPKSGVLSFYYDVEEQPWGSGEEEELSGWRVLFYDGDPAKLERVEVPEDSMLPEFAASFGQMESVDTDALIEMDFDDDDAEEIFGVLENGEPKHQMLGFPFAVQNPVFMETAHYCDGVEDWDEAEKAADDYVLLFQMDSDDDLDVMWGDMGMLYFSIKKEDLAAGRFDRTKMIMQCS